MFAGNSYVSNAYVIAAVVSIFCRIDGKSVENVCEGLNSRLQDFSLKRKINKTSRTPVYEKQSLSKLGKRPHINQ